jgi:ATPase family AAA domain-containing protein 3A/B
VSFCLFSGFPSINSLLLLATPLSKFPFQAKVERARLQDVLSTELESAVAKTAEDAALARLNEDVKLRAIRAEGEEALERARDAIALAFWSLSKGAKHLASQPEDLARVLASLILLLGGWFSAREGSLLLRKLLAKRLSKPALVRETSRQSGLRGALAFVIAAVRGLWEQLRLGLTGKLPSVGLEEAVLNGIVFAPSLRESVGGLALSVARAHSRSAPLRHLLVYGPPGTGKTMVRIV